MIVFMNYNWNLYLLVNHKTTLLKHNINMPLKTSVILLFGIFNVYGCTVGLMDLSFITSEISCTIDVISYTTYQLRYMPCGNTVECPVDGSLYMALEQETQYGPVKECWELAMDTDAAVTFNGTFNGDNAYVIQYRNGEGRFIFAFV